MGMNLECMLYLQKKGLLTSQKNKMLDIGPQNVYFCTSDQIRQFVLGQGGDVGSDSFANAAKKLEYFSTPRKGEQTTLFSEITDLTDIEYNAFDVCPAPKTELLDLNFDRLPAKHRNRYDVVLNFGTTEHVFNQWNSFAIMHEALKPGGVLYCVLPASGYLDHGYYCYTPLFFRDLAKANAYEMVDMFVAHAGESRLKALNIDMRRETQFLQSNSAQPAPEEDRIWSYNIHVVMKKTKDSLFRCALEVATSHASANEQIAARYGAEQSVVGVLGALDSTGAVQRLAAELERVYASRSWRITRPLRVLSALLQGHKSPAPSQPSVLSASCQAPTTAGVQGQSAQSQLQMLSDSIAAEAWQGHWLQSHRWHTVKELSMGVAALYGYGIEGDVVEFGTMSGVSAEGLARAIARNDMDYREARPEHLLPKKKLFLFDSFEGLPPTDNIVDADSLHVIEGTWAPGTCRGLSKDQLAAVVGKHLPTDRFSVLAGWFKDTVPTLPQTQKFGLIHVDGDLYSSTMDCLVPLFERGMVAEGALIFFDDWSPNRCSPRHGERRAWRELVERFQIESSDDGSYSLLARRFVVHSYRGMAQDYQSK